jgi:hypothetical protein
LDNQALQVYGVSRKEWEAAFRPGIQEFAALKFAIMNQQGLLRIAFGMPGPPLDEKGNRGDAIYTHAVSMTPELALELSKILRNLIAAPQRDEP